MRASVAIDNDAIISYNSSSHTGTNTTQQQLNNVGQSTAKFNKNTNSGGPNNNNFKMQIPKSPELQIVQQI